METQWNEIAVKHSQWIERMGWHNKTVLESIALIGSEIGEAAAECVGGCYTVDFGIELADIVLRTADLAQTEGVNLDKVVNSIGDLEWKARGRVEDIAQLMIDFGKLANTARKSSLGPDFGHAIGRMIRRVMDIAVAAHVDLHAEVFRKMAINEINGTRGRLK